MKWNLYREVPLCFSKLRALTDHIKRSSLNQNLTNSKVHEANMGPSGAHRTQVGPMLAPWTLLSGRYSSVLTTEIDRQSPDLKRCTKVYPYERLCGVSTAAPAIKVVIDSLTRMVIRTDIGGPSWPVQRQVDITIYTLQNNIGVHLIILADKEIYYRSGYEYE